MVNFIIKKMQINLQLTDWNNAQKNIVMRVMQQNKKIDQNGIMNLTAQEVLKKAADKIVAEVKEENTKNVIAMDPSVNVKQMNKTGFEAEITLTYYPYEEVEKIEYKNIKLDFDYKPVDNNFLDQAFNNFVTNYPLLTLANDYVRIGDIVEIAYTIRQNNQIIEQNSNMTLEVVPDKNFNINTTLLNRYLGATYSVNDPNNRNWTITIKKINRPTPTNITDKNVHLMKIPNVKNLAQLKNKVKYDFIREHANQELLRYYKTIFNRIIEKNLINYSPENIKVGRTQFLENVMGAEQVAQMDINKLLNSKNEKTQQLIESSEINAKYRISVTLLDKLVVDKEKIVIDDWLITKEMEFTSAFLGPKPANINREEVKSVLTHKKTALALAKYNNPEMYNLIIKDLKYEL